MANYQCFEGKSVQFEASSVSEEEISEYKERLLMASLIYTLFLLAALCEVQTLQA